MVKAFAMTHGADQAQLIVHFEDGHDTVLELNYDNLKELALLSQATLCQINEDMQADIDAENDALQRAEENGIRQRETDLELMYHMQHAGEI